MELDKSILDDLETSWWRTETDTKSSSRSTKSAERNNHTREAGKPSSNWTERVIGNVDGKRRGQTMNNE